MKETRSPSGMCVLRAASSQTYCRPEKREDLKKTQAKTSPVFWAAGNRRSGACADSRLHCLREHHETQRSYHRILSMLTLYRVSPIILDEHTLRQCGRTSGRAREQRGRRAEASPDRAKMAWRTGAWNLKDSRRWRAFRSRISAPFPGISASKLPGRDSMTQIPWLSRCRSGGSAEF